MSWCGCYIITRNNPCNWGIIFFVSCHSIVFLGNNETVRESWADEAGNRPKGLKAKGHGQSITMEMMECISLANITSKVFRDDVHMCTLRTLESSFFDYSYRLYSGCFFLLRIGPQQRINV